jgi:hypothetical protein
MIRLVRLLAARLGPEPVAAEPEAVAGLVARCGHLPLALAVMTARADADPGLPLRVLAGQLARAAGDDAAAAGGAAGTGPGRLEVLETGEPATSLDPGRLTCADSECVGAWGWPAAAEEHRDGDHGDGGEKPGQHRGSLQAAVAMRRLYPAQA